MDSLGRGYKVEYWQVFHPPCQIEYQIRFVHSPGRLTNKEKPGQVSLSASFPCSLQSCSAISRLCVSGCVGSSWSESNFDVNSIWQPGTGRELRAAPSSTLLSHPGPAHLFSRLYFFWQNFASYSLRSFDIFGRWMNYNCLSFGISSTILFQLSYKIF